MAFYMDPARAVQWRAFVRRSRFTEESGDLETPVAEVRRFAYPLLAAAAGGPWNTNGKWLGDRDSNPDKQSQSLLSYR